MERIHDKLKEGQARCFTLDDNGILWFGKRLVVSKVPELRKNILDEAHDSLLSIQPGSTKMYQDLKLRFWWTRMKREIARYVAKCDVYRRVKAEYLKPAGTLQPLPISSWKWEICLPFAEFSYNNSYQASIQMAPFEALYDRKCRTSLN